MDSQLRLADLRRRGQRLAESIREANLEGVIIGPGPNLAYYTGVRAQLLERPFLFFVPSEGEPRLLAPKLESGPFRSSVPMVVHGWDDTEGPSSAYDKLLKALESKGRWGCEGRVPFGFVHRLLTSGMKIGPADEMLQSIRAIKEPFELKAIRKSARILSATFKRIPELLREGMTERELARGIQENLLAGGAETVDPLVQSGPRAADPHSESSSKKVRSGESIVVDVVSSYEGYAADITRTFVVGRQNRLFEEIYDSVLSAQEKAISAAAAGVQVGKVDAAARDSLEKDGLGEYFIHRTGHGLGLEVHEAPYIVSGGKEVLREGMVFTAEPGAYLPGNLGVRIEDDVIVTAKGKDVVTSSLPKEIDWWR